MRLARTLSLLAVVGAMLLGLTGFVASGSTPTQRETADPHIVSEQGLPGIEFGTERTELAREHGLQQEPGFCSPRLPDYPQVSPVFADDQLVLLWADPPQHTPEGLAVGSPVAEVHAAFPDATELAAPAGTYQFDGLLAMTDGRGYLFLHDGETIQKIVAGYEQHALRLFHGGFGTC